MKERQRLRSRSGPPASAANPPKYPPPETPILPVPAWPAGAQTSAIPGGTVLLRTVSAGKSRAGPAVDRRSRTHRSALLCTSDSFGTTRPSTSRVMANAKTLSLNDFTRASDSSPRRPGRRGPAACGGDTSGGVPNGSGGCAGHALEPACAPGQAGDTSIMTCHLPSRANHPETPSTFFRYFPTKEDVVLQGRGPGPPGERPAPVGPQDAKAGMLRFQVSLCMPSDLQAPGRAGRSWRAR